MKNLTGKRFGLLVAQKPEYRIGNTGRHYGGFSCTCDCGTTTWCRTEDLTHGKKLSCSHSCPVRLGYSLPAFLKNTRKVGDCMVWKGATANGYARVGGYPNEKYVHREVFNYANGFYPEVVMHTCDTPPCINPKHLVAGTPKLNAEDMVEKGRSAHGVRCARAKLTEAKVIELRAKHAQGSTYSKLSKEYKLARSTISNICERKTWRHI